MPVRDCLPSCFLLEPGAECLLTMASDFCSVSCGRPCWADGLGVANLEAFNYTHACQNSLTAFHNARALAPVKEPYVSQWH